MYSHCKSASCLLRQRCSFSLYISHTGKHYHKMRVKRRPPAPMYIAIECAVYVMLYSPQDHVAVKMFLMIIFQGVHSFTTDNCLMG